MMRILALDLGTKRVGVAISDELGLTAQGLTVLNRRPHDQFLKNLAGLVQEYQVTSLVLGLPRRMDGSLGPEAQRVLSMADQLTTLLELEVLTWDERLSSVAAERVLLEADTSRRKRKQVIDKVAATYILQNYLDYLRNSPPEPDQ